jgi:preprotein translocase subunit YajC
MISIGPLSFSMIFMLVFWVLVIGGLVFLIIRQVQAKKNEKDGRFNVTIDGK